MASSQCVEVDAQRCLAKLDSSEQIDVLPSDRRDAFDDVHCRLVSGTLLLCETAINRALLEEDDNNGLLTSDNLLPFRGVGQKTQIGKGLVTSFCEEPTHTPTLEPEPIEGATDARAIRAARRYSARRGTAGEHHERQNAPGL